MTQYTVLEHNVETGEVTTRPMTDAEVQQVEKTKLELEKLREEKIAAEVKRTALLARLGITEEEAKLLLE